MPRLITPAIIALNNNFIPTVRTGLGNSIIRHRLSLNPFIPHKRSQMIVRSLRPFNQTAGTKNNIRQIRPIG
jgi:hypothetical protein